jgi:hypothetical protein
MVALTRCLFVRTDLSFTKISSVIFLSSPGAQSGDVHVVDFTDGKTNFEYTQLLWKLVNS